jgi:DNA-binding transcriptional MerR regulator
MTAEGGAMRKAPDAFRTISEAAELLDTPAHVLRFWESKFPQIKPVKRAGGRRYYRRIDIDLLAGIKILLHDQGMTIRGVQKLLAEKGPRHVAEMAPFREDGLDGDDLIELTATDGAVDPIEDAARVESAEADQIPEPDDVATPRLAPPPAPANMADAPRNAFADLGNVPVSQPPAAPKRAAVAPAPPSPAPVHAAQLAHLLRTHPPAQVNRARLAPLLQRMEALVARLTEQTARERAR